MSEDIKFKMTADGREAIKALGDTEKGVDKVTAAVQREIRQKEFALAKEQAMNLEYQKAVKLLGDVARGEQVMESSIKRAHVTVDLMREKLGLTSKEMQHTDEVARRMQIGASFKQGAVEAKALALAAREAGAEMSRLDEQMKKAGDGAGGGGGSGGGGGGGGGAGLGGLFALGSKLGIPGLGAIGGVVGILGAGKKVDSFFQESEQRKLMEAESANQTALSTVPLAAMYAGKRGSKDERFLQIAARYGMDPGAGSALGLAIPTNLGATTKDFEVGAQLARLGATPEAAGDVLVAGISRGLGSSKMADMVIGAADESKLAAGELAKSVPMTTQFTSAQSGLAATAAMSLSGIPTGRLPELTKSAGIALNDENSDFAKTMQQKINQEKWADPVTGKDLLFAGMNEVQKVQLLAEMAKDSGDPNKFASISNLKALGLQDTQAESVGMLINNADAYAETESKLGNLPQNVLRTKLENIRTEKPWVAAAWDAQTVEATKSLRRMVGDDTAGAQQTLARNQALETEFTNAGGFQKRMFLDEQGKVNRLGRMYGAFREDGLFVNPSTERNPDYLDSRQQATGGMDAAIGALIESNNRLVESLNSNSQVTDANTQATASGFPLPAAQGSQPPSASPNRNAGV